MMLDHNDDVDQKNEMEYIHVDDYIKKFNKKWVWKKKRESVILFV
jgi:hypothetical protein